ncbi:MAG: hypothetical protein OEY49_00020 [Candidatus Heimdallarchaeota archaeon]|nr:hypothetical protein [Candidatus Heimdallarchaeota archaeon]
MDRNTVIVASKNFTLAYKIKLAIGDKHNIIHIFPNMTKPTNQIIISSPQEKHLFDQQILIIHQNLSIITIRSLILKQLICKPKFFKCFIGIDPGKSIGTALLIEGEVITSNTFSSMRKLIIWISNKIKEIQYHQLVIRIGDGGGADRNYEILNSIIKQFSEISVIELVNEVNTSVRRDGKIPIHEEAAILIAKRSGKILNFK